MSSRPGSPAPAADYAETIEADGVLRLEPSDTQEAADEGLLDENGTEDIGDELTEIGRRILTLRRAHRYSLRQLARMSGLSPSFLSAVERGRGEPSISTLKRIASALDVGLVYFFSAQERGESLMVTRAGTGRCLPSVKGVEFRLLVSDPDARIEPILGRYEPDAQTGEEPMVHNTAPSAVEWGTVLSGRFKVWVGDDVFILEEGDCIYFASTIPHRIQNLSSGVSEYVWVNSPPSF
jgi:transcriptional regulator with XRE-family HTH domain